MNNEKSPEEIAAEAKAGVEELNEAIDTAEQKAAELEKRNKKNSGSGHKKLWWGLGITCVIAVGVVAGLLFAKSDEE